MADGSIDDIIRDQREAIVAAVQERMRGDETMSAVAAQRALTEGDLSAQVLGFWLQGIGSDLTLGSTTTMAQNLQWLVNLRRGHDLPFENEMVGRMFEEISVEIRARLGTDSLREEYAAYEAEVSRLIAATFPG